jgi:radical SAM family uncharacterized protein/radical SAM-linked protein
MKPKDLLFKLDNPQVYTGLEINVSKKTFNPEFTNICLVFPDTYEIGMSHYGFKILYHQLNQMDAVNAERCFLPSCSSIKTFEHHHFPLFSIENKRPLKEFDLVGFSLMSEMNYTNLLKILQMAHIPMKREDRERIFPLIIAGGISVVNPEPLREFIDIFAIGDGEVLIPDIIGVMTRLKGSLLTKEDYLESFNKLDGVYVPARSPLKKQGRFYIPSVEKGKINKRIQKELKSSIRDYQIIVPITNVVFNRLTIEIARGCPQNCRFCQAKAYYSPFREQHYHQILNLILKGLTQTGFETFSLSSLSSGDYSHLELLLQFIPEVVSPGISFSVSSLRPSSVSEYLLATIALFRRTGITIVPEAGSERLRKVINKNVSDKEIFKAVELVIKYNWEKIKLYFMVGLPTETMEDIQSIVDLIKGIQRETSKAKKRIKIHVSFSSFVPKPHTPFQWVERESLESLFEKLDYLKRKLKRSKFLDLDFHNPQKGLIETILARGDYRVGDLLIKAMERGEIFTAWDRDFHYKQWNKLIEGTEYQKFLGKISTDEPLPWEFINVFFRMEFLLREHKKSLEASQTGSCSELRCPQCQGCHWGLKKLKSTFHGDRKLTELGETVQRKQVEYHKIRLFYDKTDDFIFFSHLSMIKYLERLIRKTGIGYECTKGYHPRMKMTALPALPVFAKGLDEVVEVFLDKKFNTKEILLRLNQSSADFQFKNVMEAFGSPPLTKDLHYIGYEFLWPGLNSDKSRVEAIKPFLIDTDSMLLTRNKLILKIDYSHFGHERFSKLYKTIDPDRKRTNNLIRTFVEFND